MVRQRPAGHPCKPPTRDRMDFFEPRFFQGPWIKSRRQSVNGLTRATACRKHVPPPDPPRQPERPARSRDRAADDRAAECRRRAGRARTHRRSGDHRRGRFSRHPFTLADAEALIASGRHGRDRFLGAWSREPAAPLVGVVGTHLRGRARSRSATGSAGPPAAAASERRRSPPSSACCAAAFPAGRSWPNAGPATSPPGACCTRSAFARPARRDTAPAAASSSSKASDAAGGADGPVGRDGPKTGKRRISNRLKIREWALAGQCRRAGRHDRDDGQRTIGYRRPLRRGGSPGRRTGPAPPDRRRSPPVPRGAGERHRARLPRGRFARGGRHRHGLRDPGPEPRHRPDAARSLDAGRDRVRGTHRDPHAFSPRADPDRLRRHRSAHHARGRAARCGRLRAEGRRQGNPDPGDLRGSRWRPVHAAQSRRRAGPGAGRRQGADRRAGRPPDPAADAGARHDPPGQAQQADRLRAAGRRLDGEGPRLRDPAQARSHQPDADRDRDGLCRFRSGGRGF